MHVSSSSSTPGQTGIANAFSAIANLETLGTGVALATTPADSGGNGTVPQAEINTLANILASCINSSPTEGTQCPTLFSNATNAYGTEPTDRQQPRLILPTIRAQILRRSGDWRRR
jgi:hypothetical protein